MKPTLVADEMFPEGAGSYIELEEVRFNFKGYVMYISLLNYNFY